MYFRLYLDNGTTKVCKGSPEDIINTERRDNQKTKIIATQLMATPNTIRHLVWRKGEWRSNVQNLYVYYKDARGGVTAIDYEKSLRMNVQVEYVTAHIHSHGGVFINRYSEALLWFGNSLLKFNDLQEVFIYMNTNPSVYGSLAMSLLNATSNTDVDNRTALVV